MLNFESPVFYTEAAEVAERGQGEIVRTVG